MAMLNLGASAKVEGEGGSRLDGRLPTLTPSPRTANQHHKQSNTRCLPKSLSFSDSKSTMLLSFYAYFLLHDGYQPSSNQSTSTPIPPYPHPKRRFS